MTQHASLNRSFRLVRRADAQVVPVPETARGHGAGRAVKAAAAAVVAIAAAPIAAAAPPPGATQLPAGGTLAAGQANWQSQGSTLTVNQSSQRAVIDWQSFNLGSQGTIVFNQAAGRTGATLNRVLDSQPSQILGRIQAPGQVFISNPNGVIFGSSASVDVGSLVATSLSMSASDFMAGGTTWQRHGATGAVLNEGSLTAAEGGYVALLAPEVRNDGVIVARAGAVALAAGDAVRLEFTDAQLGSVQVSAADLKTLVENRHAILAPGGYVVLAARSADALRSGVVNQAGVIDAGSLVSRGGRVLLVGDDITLAAGSRTDAAGATGGGEVLVGGDWQGRGAVHPATHVTMAAGASIDASATAQGDGGKVVLWSDVTRSDGSTAVLGSIAARGGAQGGDGGRIETSGHGVDVAGAGIDASAAHGRGGQWLIDPTDLTIDAASASTYAGTLNAGTDVTVQTASTGSQSGDITVASALAWSSNASLTLSAARNIVVNAPITATGANATLTFAYGQGAVAAGNTATYSVYSPVSLQAGPNFTTRLGSDGSSTTWTVVTALGSAGSSNDGTLQGLGGSLGGNFVLGADIDASGTAAWNGGQGFTPIGSSGSAFTGSLDGLGHVVSGLTINRPSASYLGLFGRLGSAAVIRDLGVADATIVGNETLGVLAGYSDAAISDSYASGSVTGYRIVGGLIGNAGSGSILNSYASVNVTGTADYAGGLAGNNGSAIENVYTTGNVTGGNWVGGVVGYQNANPGASINHSYASGTVTGATNVDNLVGYRDANAVVINSAWYGNLSHQVDMDGIANNPHWFFYEGLAAPLLNAFLRPLTVTLPTSKAYDATLLADPGALTASSPGAVVLGVPVYVGSGLGPNVGSYGGVTGSGLYSGQQQGYRISYAPITLTITPAVLGVTGASAASRVYDGTAGASVSGGTLVGVYGSDAVSLSAANASFADPNAGTAKPVTTAYTLSGGGSGNYQLVQPTGLTASITPAPLTVTGAVAASKVYDGSTAATLSAGTLAGVVNGDSVGMLGSASFADKMVGTGKAVTANVTLTGASAGNYTLTQPTGLSADITPAMLTVTGAVAANKVYDGNTAATLSAGTLAGVVGGDSVGLVASGSFADKMAGTGKAVVATVSLSGADASNYTVVQPTGLTANITPAALTVVGGTAASKVYDGTTSASVTGASLAGVVYGDTVGLVTSASFADRNVGHGKTVTASVALSGADAVNYTVSSPATLTADITQLASVAWVGGTSGDWFAAGNWAGGAVPTLANVANVSIPANTVVTLANSTSANAPALTSLTGAGGLQVSQASLGVSGAIALDTLGLGSGATLAAGSVSTAHYSQSGGSVAVAGAFGVNGSFVQTGGTIRAGGAASVAQTSGDLTVQHLVGNGVTLSAAQGDLGIVNVGSVGDVSLSASGRVTQTAGGSLTVLGKADVVAGGDVGLDQPRNIVVGSLSVQGFNVSLTQGLDDLVLGNVAAGGNLALSAATGNIRQADGTALTVAGTTSASAAQGSVYLQAANNAFGGAVSASATDIAITQGAAPLVLGSVAATGNLAVISGGNVTQTGTVVVAGTTSVDAGSHDVTLAGTANDFGGAVSVQSGALSLTDGVAGLLLGQLQTSGTTIVQSLDGPIQQTAGARFLSTASSTPSFSAWLSGAYSTVSLNTDVAVLINGQASGASSIGSGVASALSLLVSPSLPAASSTDLRTVFKARRPAIPAASPVSEE